MRPPSFCTSCHNLDDDRHEAPPAAPLVPLTTGHHPRLKVSALVADRRDCEYHRCLNPSSTTSRTDRPRRPHRRVRGSHDRAFRRHRRLLDGLDARCPTDSAPPPSPTPSKSATPAKPRIVLLPTLPAQIAAKLRYSNVVVVSLYTGTSAADRSAVTEARAGARAVRAGFASINVLDEASARSLTRFGGPTDSPAVLIVRRPGRIVSEFTGPVEGKVVAQAARNAGAGR